MLYVVSVESPFAAVIDRFVIGRKQFSVEELLHCYVVSVESPFAAVIDRFVIGRKQFSVEGLLHCYMWCLSSHLLPPSLIVL